MAYDNSNTYKNSVASNDAYSGAKKALVVGINYVGTSYALNGCGDDAYNMYQQFKRNGFSKIVVMTDALKGNVRNPTKEDILYQFDRMVTTSAPGETLFFTFSGHGNLQDGTTQGEGPGNEDSIIFTADNQTIIDTELNAIVEKLPTGVRLCGLIDACHSGTDWLLKNNLDTHVDNTDPTPESYKVLVAGCGDTQTSADADMGPKPDGSGEDWEGAATASLLNQFKTRGFSAVTEDLFSGDVNKLKAVQQNMLDWMTQQGYTDQNPTITFEGTPVQVAAPAPILNAFSRARSGYPLRHTPQREERKNEYKAVAVARMNV